MDKNVRDLLAELKIKLDVIYGKQLENVYLFGSYAREEQDEESDVDMMVVLSHFDNYSTEIERTGEIISELSLKYDLAISRVFVQRQDWLAGDTLLLRNVREQEKE